MEYKPHNYQAYCIQRIVEDPAVGLFLRPGLGKTSITLSAINILRYYRWSVRKALVVAPKKVAEGTWSKEAAKWDHLEHLRVVTVLGSSAKRIKSLNTPADVYVINRENIPWLVDYYKQAWPFDMVILDESTSFKNGRSKRFKALKLVRRFMKKVVLLTGTPSSKGLEDLWAQIYLLDEGARLGKTITEYRQIYFDCNNHGGHFTEYKAKDGAEAAVLNAIGDICISMKAEDYLELPACIEHEIPVVLDDKTQKAYNRFERDMLLELDEATITAQTAGVLTGKLLQFCAGAIYDNDKNPVHLHDCKLEAYMELLEQLNGEHCITFYGYQHNKDRILAALSKTKLRVRVYTLAYAVRHSRYQADTAEAYHASRRADTADSWEAYIEPDPNRLFLPAEKQAGQMKPGMTLRQVISLLGKPQRREGSGTVCFVWKLLFGKEVYGMFLPQEEAGEFGDSLVLQEYRVK